MSVRLSAWNNLAPTWRNFIKFDILEFFRKSVKKIQVSLKSDKITCTLPEDQYTFLIISHSFLLKMTNIFRKNCRENQNTYFTFSNIWRKSYRLWYNVEKYSTAGQATDDNRAHARCKLYTWGQRHTIRICMLIAFLGNNVEGNALQCYVIVLCCSATLCNCSAFFMISGLACNKTQICYTL